MATQFRHLFSPIQIRNLTLKNRIIFNAHATGFSSDPREDPPGERYAYYLARRARGGAGMVMTGASSALVSYDVGIGRVNFWIGNAATRWPVDEPGGEAEALLRRYNQVLASVVHEAGGHIFASLRSRQVARAHPPLSPRNSSLHLPLKLRIGILVGLHASWSEMILRRSLGVQVNWQPSHARRDWMASKYELMVVTFFPSSYRLQATIELTSMEEAWRTGCASFLRPS